jgi:hypothetical protein
MTKHLMRVVSFSPLDIEPYCGRDLEDGDELRSRERGCWDCEACAAALAADPHVPFHIRPPAEPEVAG